MADFKQINKHSVFYYQKEYVLCLTNGNAYKISTRTSSIEHIKLKDYIVGQNALFLDDSFLYFITKSKEGQTSLCSVSSDMIDTGF